MNPEHDYQTIRVKFPEKDGNIQFNIQDVDASPNQFWDTVAVTPAGSAKTWGSRTDDNLGGTGTLSDPWHSTSDVLNPSWDGSRTNGAETA